ncbi:MAG: acetylxylan esterase [Clostridia bacterium]|nr:acetylxylan esterase [Clostridia bacterium]
MNMIPRVHALNLLKATTPALRYDGKTDFAAWQSEARAKLAELLGLHNIKKPESDGFNMEWVKETDEYIDYRFTITSEVGYYLPIRLRMPKGVKAPMPLLVCLHGHSSGHHNAFAEVVYPCDEKAAGVNDRAFAIRGVSEGCAAMTVELRNMGECGGTADGKPDCHVSSMAALLNGRTTIGERVHDTMCALDTVLERFDFIDKSRIICIGNSGGGTATYYTSCIDERISLAISSCSICTYKDSIAAMHHCVCNFIPNIAKYFDMGDLGGLIAPRNVIIINGIDDDIFPHAGICEAFDMIKQMYAYAGVPDNCYHYTGNGGHRFFADPTWSVVHKMLDF